MDNCVYESKLVKHSLFKDLKKSSKCISNRKLCNVLELCDDNLYAWDSAENCLLSLNLKYLEEHDAETPYQKLHFISPPQYQVERLVTSACGSRICAWGARGVTVAELPSRWGRGGLFDSGNQTILCKSHSLDERLLYCQGEVRRVHWHPSSLSHLLVLVSDNTIRLYNIALKSGPKLVKTFQIGPKPSSQLAGKTILDSLGDTAVDFTPVPHTDYLLILRGNGDVYMIDCDLDSKSPHHPQVSGPLVMYPPADDNYGTDSCCIAAMGGGDIPTLVVIATSSQQLYHCLLLPNSQAGDSGDSHALYVVEAVELSVELEPEQSDMQFSYPVHLYPSSRNTYVCVHSGGVHAISVPVLAHLKDYILSDEAQIDAILSAMHTSSGSARYLVCTRPYPPVGLALTSPPLPKLLVLCSDSSLIIRTLEPFDLEEQLYKELQLKNPALEQDDINKILKERQKLSFTSIIQEILTRDVSQPILKINKTDEPVTKQCFELLSQATLKLRGEYMSRQQRALEGMISKLHAIQSLNTQHSEWFKLLQKDINEVQLQSAVLREKCDLAEKYQDDMKYRCSAVIRHLRASSSATPAERELLSELENYKKTGERLTDQILMLKKHAQHKSEELKSWQEFSKKKDIALGKSHSDTISSILQQHTHRISTLIEETKLLKDQLNIV